MKHPYEGLPDWRFWRRAVSNVEAHLIDPVASGSFRIFAQDKVATAGSCFAQHISRALKDRGMNYFVVEGGDDIPDDLREARQFGTFSARYGNIYTPAQFHQLFQEAFGQRAPEVESWQNESGNWVDPFRPTIEPNGYTSEAEMRLARGNHLKAVRALVENLDVLVFTLGLTEAWRSRKDGSVFPLAPGVAGGLYSPDRHEYVNFSAAETEVELLGAIKILRSVNPLARVLLTVSPVPLIATFEKRHVLTSTAYSKAALRVAAENVARQLDNVDYFPSFELITSPTAGGRYFADDLRSVNRAGVAHVMRVFEKHYLANPGSAPSPVPASDILAESDVICDEELIGALRKT